MLDLPAGKRDELAAQLTWFAHRDRFGIADDRRQRDFHKDSEARCATLSSMKTAATPLESKATAEETQRRLEAQHLQVVEGNPLTAAEISMFEIFEREGWSPERRRARIMAQFKRPASPQAAE
jgi:hypothetical protein